MSNSNLHMFFVFLFFSFSLSFASPSYINTTLTTTTTTTATTTTTTTTTNTHQCSALLLFKENLSSFNFSIDWVYCEGYYPIMMNWNTSTTNCCYWDGVTCNHSTGDVIELDLSCGMLQGTLHPNTSLFNLPYLQKLNLAFNDLTGSQLPSEIGRISSTLTHLNISYSGLSGQDSTDITLFQKLVSLDLSWNFGLSLEPRVFIKLLQNHTTLEELSLGEINIPLVLPTHLNISYSSLKILNLYATGLHGELPHYISNLQSLEKLDLSNNGFTGQIPWEISLLPKLLSLDLSWNDDLRIKPYIFNSLLKNSTLLRLRLNNVKIGLGLPPYLNISSSMKSLHLHGTFLKGKLPDNIFSLQYLEELDLSGNTELTGPMPRVEDTIPLKVLDLSSTDLSGEISNSIGHFKSLIRLDLSNCGFTGSLPKSIGNLRRLTSLVLISNKLNGTLPLSLFSLRSLETLILTQNQFVGKIDVLDDQGPLVQTFRKLTNLVYLDLSYNNFSGDWELDTLLSSLTNLDGVSLSYSGVSVTTSNVNHHVYPDFNSLELASCKLKVFPVVLQSMGSLTRLDLSSNEIHGQIPQWAGEIGGRWLHHLNLSNNFITGLPRFQWSGLEILHLQSNLIEAPFPSSICNMSELSNLDLSNNRFDDVIPQCFENITSSLEMINLGNNRFRGPFPPSICKMNQLWFLDLSNNSFDAVIPKCLGNITSSSLQMINLGNNRFRGTIPNVYGNCGPLEGLILNGNQLEGKVPNSLSNCVFLKVLNMGNNHLNGTFPEWLKSLPYLQVLVLKSNSFHGHIVPSFYEFTFSSLQVIDLSHNGFKGQLPRTYFQNFNAMSSVKRSTEPQPEYLSVRGQFYSFIVTVKGVEQPFTQLYIYYTIICLSHNNFVGEIPDIIGNLNSLVVLDLSHNSLTGQIPHTLGNLSEIESLDLSCNQLIGKIPQSLADLTFLGFLNLSQNHLVGIIPVGKQFNTFQEKSFEGNLNLCGPPLPKKCNDNPQDPQLEGDRDGNDDESGFTWRVVMLGYGCGTLLGLVMGYLMLSTGRPMWFNSIVDAMEQMILERRNKRRYIYIGR